MRLGKLDVPSDFAEDLFLVVGVVLTSVDDCATVISPRPVLREHKQRSDEAQSNNVRGTGGPSRSLQLTSGLGCSNAQRRARRPSTGGEPRNDRTARKHFSPGRHNFRVASGPLESLRTQAAAARARRSRLKCSAHVQSPCLSVAVSGCRLGNVAVPATSGKVQWMRGCSFLPKSEHPHPHPARPTSTDCPTQSLALPLTASTPSKARTTPAASEQWRDNRIQH